MTFAAVLAVIFITVISFGTWNISMLSSAKNDLESQLSRADNEISRFSDDMNRLEYSLENSIRASLKSRPVF